MGADGIDVRVINMSTIKPLDEYAVIKAAEETGAIVTAENHSIIGGLGEVVASLLAEISQRPCSELVLKTNFPRQLPLPKKVMLLKRTSG